MTHPTVRFAEYAKREGSMETLVNLGQFFSGVGIMLLGVAALWFVTVYSEKK